MKSLDNVLCWGVAVIAFAFAIWQLFVFLTFKDAQGIPDMMAGASHLWWAIGAAIVACACIVISFVRHPHVEEEIHVTK